MSVLTIARVELLRLLRDRSNLFFVFVFPLLLVLLIGASFGGSGEQRLVAASPDGDPAAAELLAVLDDATGIEVVAVEDADEVEAEVSRGLASAGVVVPDGYGASLDAGTPVEVGFVARPDAGATALRALVDEAVAARSAEIVAADLAAAATGGDAVALRATAAEVAAQLVGVEVVAQEVGGDELAREFAGLGQFELGASSQLFLFTFLTSMTGGIALIQTRQYGIARRMLATPTRIGTILLGEAAGRLLVALAQAIYIIVATALLFRVDWGQPLATSLVVLLFCLAAAGAGMLVGAAFRNESQAGGVAVGLGLGLAALGGSMVPLEVFPEAMLPVASLTPHAWANRAMAELVRRDGGLADVTMELIVLAGFAEGLLGLATWWLRRTLVR